MHKHHRLVNIFNVRSGLVQPGQTAHNQISGLFTYAFLGIGNLLLHIRG